MKKLVLDTNFWIRLFTHDHEEKYQQVVKVLELIESGKFSAYTTNIVILEVNFILGKYGLTKRESLKYLKTMISLKGITVIEKTSSKEAIKLQEKYNIKLADCYIAAQIPSSGCLLTFDEEFRKIKGLNVVAPKDL